MARARLKCWLVAGMMAAGLLLAGPAGGPVCDAAAAEGIRVTILYDNTTAVDGTQADWGFSALVEGGEKTILFDTGTKPEILKHNVEELGVDLSGVDVVFLSHDHGDHTGGLDFVLENIKGVPVYFGAAFRQEFDARVRELGAEPVRIKDPYEICPGIFSTGEMSGPVFEQSLIFDTGEGLTVMTGCAHPGVDKIVARARELHGKPVTFVFGGFHLMQKTRQEVNAIIGRFAEAGVERCGATHCTGEQQIGWFQEHYKDHFVPMGIGRIIPITD